MDGHRSDKHVPANSSQTIAAILLAAGNGRRFGSNKLMAKVGKKKVYEHILDKLVQLDHQARICVSQYPEILDAAEKMGFCTVFNDAPELGISRSIRLGLLAALEGEASGGPSEDIFLDGNKEYAIGAAMFVVCDQPLLRLSSVETLLKVHRETDKGMVGLCTANGQGRRGNPVIFDRKYFQELLHLQGDTGGRQVMSRHPEDILWVPAAAPEELMDIDTAEQLNALNNHIGDGTIRLD